MCKQAFRGFILDYKGLRILFLFYNQTCQVMILILIFNEEKKVRVRLEVQ